MQTACSIFCGSPPLRAGRGGWKEIKCLFSLKEFLPSFHLVCVPFVFHPRAVAGAEHDDGADTQPAASRKLSRRCLRAAPQGGMAYEAKAASFPNTAPTTFAGSFAPASGLDAYQAKMKVAQEAIITRCERDEAAELARINRRPSTVMPGLPRVFFDVKADNQPLGRLAC
jgi:hypothetical protein